MSLILDFVSSFTGNDSHGSGSFVSPGFGLGRRTSTGKRVTANVAFQVSAYFACIRNISEDVGKLPFNVRRTTTGESSVKMPDNRIHHLIHDEPNPETIPMVFWETITQWAASWGNGYAEIARDRRGRPAALWLMHPSRVQPRRNEQGDIVYDVFSSGDLFGRTESARIELPAKDVIHIKGFGNGVVGYSVLSFAAETIAIAACAQQQQGAFFRNGATLTGVLEHPTSLNEEGRQQLRKEWQKLYSGSHNSGKVAVLWDGMSFNPISVPPKDAETLKTRAFQVVEIARWFRMPPHKIQDLSHATFSNIESQGIEYVGDALTPWMVRVEQEVNKKLLPGQSAIFTKFNDNELLRGDSVARTNKARAMLQGGALTPNEWREVEDIDRSEEEGANMLYMQTAMAPISQIIDSTANTATAASTSTAMSAETMQPIISHQAQYLNRKESAALGKAETRFENDQEALNEWAMTFYGRHRADLYKAMSVAVRTVCPMADGGLKTLINEHCEKQLQAIAAGGSPRTSDEYLTEKIITMMKELG